MDRVRKINIKMCTYYFNGDMIIIKNIDHNIIKIDKKII